MKNKKLKKYLVNQILLSMVMYVDQWDFKKYQEVENPKINLAVEYRYGGPVSIKKYSGGSLEIELNIIESIKLKKAIKNLKIRQALKGFKEDYFNTVSKKLNSEREYLKAELGIAI